MLNIFKLQFWRTTEFSVAPAKPLAALVRTVPRKFETLEVWLLLFCGAYGLLVSSAVVGGARDAALACVALMCMAAWRRFNPARNQTQWLVSAMLALLIVACVYVDPRSGGSTGPFLFLLLLMAMGYPLLMDAPGLTMFTVAMLLLYFATGWQRKAGVGQELFFARGVLIAGMAMLSGRFGAVLRLAEHNIDDLRRDVASLAYNEHGLERYGSRLLRLCASEMQPCTLVLLPMPPSWHDPINVSGRGSEFSANRSAQLQQRALRDMALHLTLSFPAEAVISRNQQGDWVILVPWMDQQTALNRIEVAFGRPVQLPFGPREDEMFVVITPCAVVSRGSADTVGAMHSRAQDIWLRGVRTGAVASLEA
jgi:multisubunit Na+/H+ antiporter MnhB subunit